MLSRLLFASSLVFGAAAAKAETRDHEPNMQNVAYYAYQLADDSENFAHYAQHQNWQIARAAQDLHLEASDVYHLAGNPVRDHDHDERVRREFQDVARAYQTLEWYVGYNPTRDHAFDAHWRRIRQDYSNLYYNVYGVN